MELLRPFLAKRIASADLRDFGVLLAASVVLSLLASLLVVRLMPPRPAPTTRTEPSSLTRPRDMVGA